MPELTPELRADFLEWLRTGSFRGVRLGMTRAECVERLGEPESWTCGQNLQTAGIVHWNDIEFHFGTDEYTPQLRKDILYLIYSDWPSTIAALFGYGYDDDRLISVIEIEDLLASIGTDILLVKEKEDFFESLVIKYTSQNSPNTFKFALDRDSGHEYVSFIEQNMLD